MKRKHAEKHGPYIGEIIKKQKFMSLMNKEECKHCWHEWVEYSTVEYSQELPYIIGPSYAILKEYHFRCCRCGKEVSTRESQYPKIYTHT